ncbi:hypothetical protein [Vibrio sp. SCSIO 43135]|uniref:hypothetical protein n=1 Tax=Vibrio sp. SCSIO 43135 TaxID=2819096 RepID=UPI002075C5A1|nr:hypothetical protein [Vibrio sp. SCSIO 43135]
MRAQTGIATLLVTSVLLTAALLITLGSYKSLFYQIKRAQNEVKARQQHWVAEGALECFYTKAIQTQTIPQSSNFFECNTNGTVTFGFQTLTANQTLVTASYGFTQIQKILTYPGKGASGVMKATSNLYFAGGMAMRPDPGTSLGDDEWGCTMLRYSSDFKVFGTISNQNLNDAHPPYAGFPSGQSCRNSSGDSYITTAIGNYNTPANLQQDFVNDTSQKPFEDLFATPREQWFEVMSSKEFIKISDSILVNGSGELLYEQSTLPAPQIVTHCGDEIATAIESGEDLIWVYGSCHLDSDDLANIGEAIDPATGISPIAGGVILVIHNGLLSTSGALDFKGMLYHFVSEDSDGEPEFEPTASLWESLDAPQKLVLDGAVGPVSGVSASNTAYFQSGSFYPIGGYVMDAPGTYAVYNSSVSFSYDQDVINVPLSKLKKLEWKSGGWYVQ